MATVTAATLFGTSATADNVIDWAEIAGKPAFKAIATTGAYADLTGTPTLGTAASKDTGTAAGQIMVVDGAGKLPVIDGSNLTNVAALTAVTAATASAVAVDVVTNAGLANMPAMRMKGAIVAGDPLDLTPAQIRQVIGSDHPGVIDMFIRADGAVSEIPTQALAAGSVTDATLEDMPANTVKGALVTGNPGNLTPSQLRQILGSDNPTNNTAFIRADGQIAIPPGATGGTTATLIAGQVTTTELADNAATNAKLADMPAFTLKMRNAATAGDAQDVGAHQLPKVASPAANREFIHADPATGALQTSPVTALAAPGIPNGATVPVNSIIAVNSPMRPSGSTISNVRYFANGSSWSYITPAQLIADGGSGTEGTAVTGTFTITSIINGSLLLAVRTS